MNSLSFFTYNHSCHSYYVSSLQHINLTITNTAQTCTLIPSFPMPHQTTHITSLSISELQQKQYSIRLATVSDFDLTALWEIEQTCWAPELQVAQSELENRILRYPAGQWLATVVENGEEKVVGVMFTQPIADRVALINGTVTFETQGTLCCYNANEAANTSATTPSSTSASQDSNGTTTASTSNSTTSSANTGLPGLCHTLQLLGVAVLPAYSHKQLGTALRNYVLQVARLDGFQDVCAMTRCSGYVGMCSKSKCGCRHARVCMCVCMCACMYVYAIEEMLHLCMFKR